MGPQGSPPMGSLGLPRVSLRWDHLGSQGFLSHWIPWVPKGSLPWDPLGSQGFPLPWVPSHGIPLGSQGSPPMGSHPTSPSFFVRPGRKLTTKELTRGFLARSHVCVHYRTGTFPRGPKISNKLHNELQIPQIFCPAGQNINYKRINQRLFSKVSYGANKS